MRKRTWIATSQWLPPIAQAATAGIVMGLVVIISGRLAYDWRTWMFAHLVVGAVLGSWNARRAWLCWPPFGAGLFLVHFVVASLGGRPAYLSSWEATKGDLVMLAPAAAGLAFGVLARAGLSNFGWFRDPDANPVRVLPRSTSGLLGSVACLAIAFPILRWSVFDSGTLYTAGYDEAAFLSIREGAEADAVEKLLGPPQEDATFGCWARRWEYTHSTLWHRKRHIRWIIFDLESRVLCKRREFDHD